MCGGYISVRLAVHCKLNDRWGIFQVCELPARPVISSRYENNQDSIPEVNHVDLFRVLHQQMGKAEQLENIRVP